MKVLKWVLGILLGLIIALVAWGLIEPYLIDETAYTVDIPNLPAGWEGQRVAAIADFQIGMWLDNDPTIRRIVARIIEDRPAAVVILGDQIYHGGETPVSRIERTAELVSPLTEARIPVYAVLGNHDYGMSSYQSESLQERAQQLTEALEAIGVDVLENEAVILEAEAEGDVYVVGIGSHMAHRDHPEEALEDVPEGAARLVIAHNPQTFSYIPAFEAPLTVSGHTHGGQIRIPFTPSWSWITYLKQEDFHADGWARDYGESGNRLYVNRGIGFSALPIRINCRPELTYFTLEAPSG